jgi:hypothetical protein
MPQKYKIGEEVIVEFYATITGAALVDDNIVYRVEGKNGQSAYQVRENNIFSAIKLENISKK